jgi:Methyltransferase domain
MAYGSIPASIPSTIDRAIPTPQKTSSNRDIISDVERIYCRRCPIQLQPLTPAQAEGEATDDEVDLEVPPQLPGGPSLRVARWGVAVAVADDPPFARAPAGRSVACGGHVGDAHAADHANQVGDTILRFAVLLRPGAHILDAGTGPDLDLARFLALGHRPVGVNLNVALTAEDARHSPSVGHHRVLPFNACYFDGIWARASLMHLPTGEAKDALGELFRVAASGAPVCVSVKIAGRTGWAETNQGRRWFQFWEPASFAAAVRAAGFTVRSVEPGPVFVDVWATA